MLSARYVYKESNSSSEADSSRKRTSIGGARMGCTPSAWNWLDTRFALEKEQDRLLSANRGVVKLLQVRVRKAGVHIFTLAKWMTVTRAQPSGATTFSIVSLSVKSPSTISTRGSALTASSSIFGSFKSKSVSFVSGSSSVGWNEEKGRKKKEEEKGKERRRCEFIYYSVL